MAPDTIGRYRVLRQLGAGGMGEVYLGEDPGLKRRVAIKMLPAASAGNETADARLVREAQAAATLDHPNVCAIYEVGEHGGQHFIAMQYVEGETLADRLARGPLPVSEALRTAEQIADALSEAHAHGIVHRDIKPGNIMLAARGPAKVLDFGLAKQLPLADTSAADADTIQGLTTVGAVVGTTAYMSPEQLRGEEPDARTDVFSLGCVVQEMLGGRHPFAQPSTAATIAAILNEPPLPLPNHVPQELQRILRKCLDKDRERRYGSARDLLIDLRNLVRDTSSGLSIPAARPRRRLRLILTAAAAIAVMVGIGMWWRLLRPASADRPIRVLAILPLAAADSSSEYLGDGISENVINSLSQLSELKVLARTTTFRYRGASVDMAALRRDLSVDAVLTGRVVQEGDSLIVSAELTNTADGAQVWGHRYNNRRLADVFAVQEEIARDIATGLKVELAGRDARFSKRETDDVEAYRMYVVGREYAQRRTVVDLEAAVDNYRRAIARDKRYALAWAGLTDAYVLLASRSALQPAEGRRLAMEAADRALAIDPGLAETNAAVGQIKVYSAPFDFEGGDRALRRAIELNPGWAIAHQFLAVSLLEQGRLDEGVRELEVAHALDPLSGFITRFLAFAHLLKGDAAKAMSIYRSAAALGPPFATYWDVELYQQANAVDEGIAELARTSQGREADPYVRLSRVVLQAAKGNKAEALLLAAEFERLSASNAAWASFAGRIYIALGDYDHGLELLNRAIDAEAMPIFYKDQPLWKPIRRDPRFQDILHRMRVPPDQR
jgi:serine/threonine protein kinase/tetratricopeptide (TPR) repeat protein